MRLLLIISLFTFRISYADIYSANPDNYIQYIKKLDDGDVLSLVAGVYEKGMPVHFLNGSPGSYIIIEGPNSGEKAILNGRKGHNAISIIDSSYIVVRNIEINGQENMISGIKAEGHSRYAHHITLENLLIHNFARHQQTVGISTKCPSWGWVIRHNTIIGIGTGMYFGNSDGRAPFVESTIENNMVIATMGYNLQIKHQKNYKKGIPGFPYRDATTIIRHNVFSKEWNASREGLARPNVLVGHWPASGSTGANSMYYIYGNLFFQNPTEALFQGEGNLALYNNIFFNSYPTEFPVVAIHKHHSVPKNIHIFNNTVVSKGAGIRITGADKRYTQHVIANAVFSPTPIAGGNRRANITGEYQAAPQFFTNPSANINEIDLYPLPGKLRAESAVDLGEAMHFPDANIDFDGVSRSGKYRGAYVGGRPGPEWKLKLGIKPVSPY